MDNGASMEATAAHHRSRTNTAVVATINCHFYGITVTVLLVWAKKEGIKLL